MSHTLRLFVTALAGVCLASVLSAPAGAAGFGFKDTRGEYLDVTLDGRVVARWMYAYDKSTPERLHETYKPYLHIFGPDGTKPITKGAGGKYSHHRGIFCGWKVGVAGKTYDFWHILKDLNGCRKNFGKPSHLMLHQKALDQKAGAGQATFTALIHWNDPAGSVLIGEARTLVFTRRPAPAVIQVDLVTRLKAVAGDAAFGGDPEHAGCQYRPANEVDVKKTRYVFPAGVTDVKKERDLPWAACQHTIEGKTYSVLHMNHPDNPKGTVYSAYRDYGRFGAFPKFNLKQGAEQVLRYRCLILQGEMPPAAQLQKESDAFAKAPTN